MAKTNIDGCQHFELLYNLVFFLFMNFHTIATVHIEFFSKNLFSDVIWKKRGKNFGNFWTSKLIIKKEKLISNILSFF